MTRVEFADFVRATFNAIDMITPAEGAAAVINAFDEYEAAQRLCADALAPQEPTRNEWRLDDRGDLDDVVVNDVVTFRLERMHDDHVWGRVYRRDGSQTDFNLHSERPITLTYEHDGLPAPRADALEAPPTPGPSST